MNRRYRLTSPSDFKRVRRLGKSYAHPLVILIASRNEAEITRMGITAGRALGNAVQRNRAKRRLREVLRVLHPVVQPGWDLVFIARPALAEVEIQGIRSALTALLGRAALLTLEGTESKSLDR